jgi:hypothetical protein
MDPVLHRPNKYNYHFQEPYLRAWIQNFLTDRHLAPTINGHQTGPFPLTRGVLPYLHYSL